MERFRVTDDVLDQLVRAYAVFGVRPEAALVPTVAADRELPADWSAQIARAYAMFGTAPVDGADEFGLWGKLKAGFKGARRGWDEGDVVRAPEGSKKGGQFIEKPGAFLPKPAAKLDLDTVTEKVHESIANARREADRLRRIPPGMLVAGPANPGMPLPPKLDPVARARAYEEWAAAYDAFHEQMTGRKPPQRIHGNLDHDRAVQYASYMDGWMEMYRWWYDGNKHHWDKPEPERPTPQKPDEPPKPAPAPGPAPTPKPVQPDPTETVDDPPDEPEPADSDEWVQDVLPGMEDLEPATPTNGNEEESVDEDGEASAAADQTPTPQTPEPQKPEPQKPEPQKPEPQKPEPRVNKRKPNKAEYDNARRLADARVEPDTDGNPVLVDADGNPFDTIDDTTTTLDMQQRNVVQRIKDNDGNPIGWIAVEGPDLGKVKYEQRTTPPKPEPAPVQPEPQRIDTTTDPGPRPVPRNPRITTTPEGDRTVVDEDGNNVPIRQDELDWAEQAELIYDENDEPAGWIPQDGTQAGYFFPLDDDEKKAIQQMFKNEEETEGTKEQLQKEREEKQRRKNKRAMEREAMKQMWQKFLEDMKEKGKQRWDDAREKQRKEEFDKSAAEWKKNFKPDSNGNGDPPGKRHNVRIQRGDQELDLELELDRDMNPAPFSFAIARDKNGNIVGVADARKDGQQYPIGSYSPGDLQRHGYRKVMGREKGKPLGVIIRQGPKKGQFIPWTDEMEKKSEPTNKPQPGINPAPKNTPAPNGNEPADIAAAQKAAAAATKKRIEESAAAVMEAAGDKKQEIIKAILAKDYKKFSELVKGTDAPESAKDFLGNATYLTDKQWEILEDTLSGVPDDLKEILRPAMAATRRTFEEAIQSMASKTSITTQKEILQAIKSKNVKKLGELIKGTQTSTAVKNMLGNVGTLTDKQWAILEAALEQQLAKAGR